MKAGLALATAGFVVFGTTAGSAFAGLGGVTARESGGAEEGSPAPAVTTNGTSPGAPADSAAATSGGSSAGASGGSAGTAGGASAGASGGASGGSSGASAGTAGGASAGASSGASGGASGSAGGASDSADADDAAGPSGSASASESASASGSASASPGGSASPSRRPGATTKTGDATGNRTGAAGTKRVKVVSDDPLGTNKRGAGKDTDAPSAVTLTEVPGDPGDPATDPSAGPSGSAGASASPSAAADALPSASPTPGVGILSTPAAPSNVTAVPVNSGIQVSWSHDGTAVDHYTATAYDPDNVAAASCLGGTAADLACDIAGLTPGTSYTVQVVAYGSADSSEPSEPATSGAVVPGPPATPTGVHATGKTPTTLTVHWTAPASPAGAIDHFVVTSPEDGAKTCQTTGGTATSCDIADLAADTGYTFQVQAIGKGLVGDSALSDPSAAVKVGPPDAPTDVTATAVAAHTLRVSWTAPAETRGGVKRYVATSVEDATKTCDTTDGGSTYCEIDGLTAGGAGYTFTVVAEGNGTSGDSAPSAASTPAVAAGPPGEPTGLQVSAGDSELAVEWVAPGNVGSGLAGYTVETVEDPAKNCGAVDDTVHACTISGLANGTEYTVRVRADGVGTSGDSDWVSAAKVAPSVAPAAPAGVAATAKVEAIAVSWTAGPAGSGVKRFKATATAPGGATQSCETTDGTGTSCTITGLVAGVTYSVAVRALGLYGRDSDWSTPAATAMPAAVTVPAEVPPASGTVDSSSGSAVAPGEQITISGTGFAPNTTIKVALYSTPTVLATTTTDGAGAFSVPVTVPAGLSGAHTLVASGVDSNGQPRYLNLAVAVSTDHAVDTGGSGGGSSSSGGSGSLAVTGEPISSIALGGLLMLAGGLALTVLARWRRSLE
ncbi:fibronectin type III domain-containing protein [Dactylosporangium sp. AC04546]|uniref:fibronectin type III domain-containing protein n=1 Tax=Dactylosporangium sp. AC04546 TaxID=2862460 RepID=UPI002E7ADA0A|nr:fibronectin type III domain-containing protein [Dactylosporangium sp. AC04546]WVK89362.1 fibronectin type III domain-containing protein [Dactylosporangium sp. AC04546]